MPKTISINFSAQVAGFNAAMSSAAAKARSLGSDLTSSGRKSSAAIDAMTASARRLTQAERNVANAAGQVRVAQARQQAVLAAGRSTTLQRISAEEGLARSHRNLATAQLAAEKSTDRSDYRLNRLSHTATFAGLAIAGGFAVAVREAAKFEDATDSVAATGADRLGDLRDQALQVGKTMKYTAIEATEAQENLIKAGVSSTDVLGGGLAGALNLASAGGLSLSEAAETAAKAMTQFGLSGKAVPHIADLLAAGANEASGDVHDMGMALAQSGLIANQFGISVDDTVGALTAFGKAGLIGSDAGTSFKTMLTRLANPARQTKETMDKLGISAYDAQGNFVGLTDLADQLKTKLGPLSQATRDQALAQIFGTDAIRAANVLYNEGGDGLQKIIDGVNQFGYASTAAHIKSDNFLGDLQKLKATVSTSLIENGDAGQGFLRGATQGLTNFINKANALPPATKGAIAAAAGIAGAGALTVGGLAKVAVTIGDLRTGLGDLRESFPRTASALTGLGKAGLVAAGFLAAVSAAMLIADTNTEHFNLTSEAAGAALTELGTKGKALDFSSTTGFTGLARDAAKAKPEVEGIGDALAKLSNLSLNDRGNLKLDSIFNTQLSGLTKAKQQIAEYDKSLVDLTGTGHGADAQAAFAKITSEAEKQGVTVEQLKAQFPEYAAALTQAASDVDYTFASTGELIKAMGGDLPPALTAALSAASGTAGAFQTMEQATTNAKTALGQLATAGRLANDALTALNNSIFGEANIVQSQKDGWVALKGAVLAASEAHKTNGSTLNASTAKGQQNLQVLGQLRTAAQNSISTLVANATTEEQVERGAKSRRNEAIEGYLRLAGQYGKTGKAAEAAKGKAKEFADQAGLKPADIVQEYKVKQAEGNEAALAAYQQALKGIKPEYRSQIEAEFKDKGPKAALALLEKLDGKEAKPKVAVKGTDKAAADAKKAGTAVDNTGKKVATPKVNLKDNASGKLPPISGKLAGLNKTTATPQVNVKADTSGASRAQGAINAVHGKTVTITSIYRDVHRSVIESAPKGNATGGYITGPGTATSDSIPARLSNGEFVIRAAAVKAAGLSTLHQINSLGYAAGGLVGKVRGYATGGYVGDLNRGLSFPGVNFNVVIRLLTALQTPIADLRKATSDVAAAVKASQAANRALVRPLATFTAADKANTRARDARDKQRAADAKEVLPYQKKIATAAERERKAAEARERAQRRVSDARKTKSKADDASAAKALKSAQKAEDRREAELAKARAKKTSVANGNTATMAKLNADYTKTQKERTKAQDAYTKAQDRAKAASDKLKDAQAELASQQKALADSARQVSDSFREQYNSQSTDVRDWIAIMREGAGDTKKFGEQIAALRKAGLSETQIQTIIGRGAVAGGDIATQLLANKELIKQLNGAASGLQNASDKLGLIAVTGTPRFATGGFVSGPGSATSDSIAARLSNGEFVINARDTADVYSGRRVIDRNYVQGFRNGGYASAVARPSVREGDIIVTGNTMTPDPWAIAERIRIRKRDAMAVTGAGMRV